MYKVLAIGNSFSEDATYFLHQIYESSEIENEIINLYIGGCSLEHHWRNIENNSKGYQYQKNGVKTDRYVSIQEILEEDQFDVIVTHQVSGDSGWQDTYEPFLGLIIKYLSDNSNSKIYLNQTWAYEKNSNHENFMRYERNQQQMFNALKKAYEDSAQRHGLPLIRSGEVVQEIRKLPYFKDGVHCITRDGFHMNYLYGRYAIALMWAKTILGIDVMVNSFVPKIDFMPSEDSDIKLINQIKQIVYKIN